MGDNLSMYIHPQDDIAGEKTPNYKFPEELKDGNSSLRRVLREHFEAFDGLTESSPIYKDKESEQTNGN